MINDPLGQYHSVLLLDRVFMLLTLWVNFRFHFYLRVNASLEHGKGSPHFD